MSSGKSERMRKAQGEDIKGAASVSSRLGEASYEDQHHSAEAGIANGSSYKAAGFKVKVEDPGGRSRNSVSPVKKAIGDEKQRDLKAYYKRKRGGG